ncbi:hypothetical protein DL96DRAFT_1269466 [Flagelloscypha sp. PMI_526]|nr:hypothetical protein DL96DRAFT_1269466 [Flagelloscypha sp. PMI_526]
MLTFYSASNFAQCSLRLVLRVRLPYSGPSLTVVIIPVCGDVSNGRTKGALISRRSLTSTNLVCKILGAASQAN